MPHRLRQNSESTWSNIELGTNVRCAGHVFVALTDVVLLRQTGSSVSLTVAYYILRFCLFCCFSTCLRLVDVAAVIG